MKSVAPTNETTMKRVTQSLLMQLHLTDQEIVRRKELLALSEEDIGLLVRCRPFIEENIDVIVNEFYEEQTSIEEIALLIGDLDTLQRLHAAQRKYVLDLFSGFTDIEYVNNRLRIGLVHKRIGVEPKLYLSAVKTLKDIINKALERSIRDPALLAKTCQALDKLLYFDVTLVFDTYIRSLISEIETAKERSENYAKNLEFQVAERTRQLKELSDRDPLSNLFNQRAFRAALRREMAHAKRVLTPLALIYFDVDNFKQLNDQQGHPFGDSVLKFLGDTLLQEVRETDLPCRYGGDEFCIILPECDYEAAEVVCRKIIEVFGAKFPTITLSFGIAQTGPTTFVEPDELIKQADEKMYQAKAEPGFQVKW